MPPDHCRGLTPFAEGPENARVMIIGQNPGREEVKQGRPFVGRAGKYLNQVLEKNGLHRKNMYLTEVVKEPTPGNRKPKAGEIKRWTPSLLSEIRRVGPRIVVLMGRVAWEAPRLEGIDYLETYHPAAAMRFPKIRREFEEGIRRLKRKLAE